FLHSLGPVRLARRPAEHPPDQRQDSAVTYVAICVVCTIAFKKHFCANKCRQGMTSRHGGPDYRPHAPRGTRRS
ncbi:hypothetical protein ALP23_05110, partial [Pseudomonas syringae pv. apii]